MNKQKIELALEAINDGWLATAKGILQDIISEENSTIEDEKKLFVVDTTSTLRISYAVEAKDEKTAADFVHKSIEVDEVFLRPFYETDVWGQESVSSVKEISIEEFLKEFDAENPELKDLSATEKFEFINRSR